MEFLLQSGKRPDIIHGHDWQAAVVVNCPSSARHLIQIIAFVIWNFRFFITRLFFPEDF